MWVFQAMRSVRPHTQAVKTIGACCTLILACVGQRTLPGNTSDYIAGMPHIFGLNLLVVLLILVTALFFAWWFYRETQQRLKNLVHLETEHLLEVQERTNLELQLANLTLRASETKLAVTLNSIGDAVIATDANACVTLLNPVAEQLTGWTQEQAAGRAVDEIFRIFNRETRESALVPVAQTLAHGTSQGLANHTILKSRSGTERDIADSCAPIRDINGAVVGAVLVFRDVSRDYAIQQELRDSAGLIQAILNTVADGLITVSATSGIVEQVNPAALRMFGYSSEELTGNNLNLLIPELAQDQGTRSLSYYGASAAELAAGLGREVTGRRKDGSTFPLAIAVSEMTLSGQRYFTGVLRDVTARKQFEVERARLDQVLQDKNVELESARKVADTANQAKSDFLSNMSHELRSPLNAILGFAQLLELGEPAPTPKQNASVGQILKAGWYLLELINEILDLALIESGRLSLSLEPTSLQEVLHDCQAMIAPQAQQKGIRVKFAPIDPACFVIADSTRLKQVVINLLSNAIKYNRSGGMAEVTCKLHSNGRLRISVRDTGEGLSALKMAQLFQPFNRLGQETGVEEGTGIGLVVSRRLVELMGGEIGVTSTVGVGSVFWFELKSALVPELADDAPAAPVAATLQEPADAAMRTLLYVEDNQANMALVEQLIARRPDMRLLGAGDAMRGIAMARAHQPDLILMDINLPGISGMQALAILQQDATTRHIPVLALSANAMPRDIEKGLVAGFFRYLTKPIRINEFMEALDQGLALAKVNAMQ